MAVADAATISVFNTLSWPRTGLVTLPKGVTGLKDTPTHKLSTGETVFLARDVPALGVKNYPTDPTDRTDPSDQSDLIVTPTSLENSLVKVTIDSQTGDIVSLRREGREFIKKEANTYRYLKGGGAPASATAPTGVKISVKENGPILASLLVESKAEGCNWLKREVRILAGQPGVEIINTLDKLAITQKEGVHFGFAFNVVNPVMRLDIPWGVMRPEVDQLPGSNKNWLAVQRWADVSNGEMGVTWASLDAPLIEVGDITANILPNEHSFNPNPHWVGPRPIEDIPELEAARFEWLRRLSPTATLYSWALNNHWSGNFLLSQEGVLTFRYSILPHGAYDAVPANRFGLEQNRPLIATAVKAPVTVAPPVALDNPRVFISTLKTGPDGLAVTLRSLSEKPETVHLIQPGNPTPEAINLPPYGIVLRTLKRSGPHAAGAR